MLGDLNVVAQTLTALAGMILSIIFTLLAYFPGTKEKFETLTGDQKRAIMCGLLLAVAIGLGIYYWRAGAPWEEIVVKMIWGFILALMANQGVYSFTNKHASVLSAWSNEPLSDPLSAPRIGTYDDYVRSANIPRNIKQYVLAIAMMMAPVTQRQKIQALWDAEETQSGKDHGVQVDWKNPGR